ncbi:MAG TPA: hypothetical protein VMX13_06000 [Sedimentisphaerales bacterium]|nr:hypothetical protein [Sedimentisphaerales bacterium]
MRKNEMGIWFGENGAWQGKLAAAKRRMRGFRVQFGSVGNWVADVERL